MTELIQIADQIKRAFQGPAWSGPSLMEVLVDVSPARAAWKPAKAHSIWEIVLHIGAWEAIGRRRLEGELLVDVPTEEDWPPVNETTEAAWRQAVERLQSGNKLLIDVVQALPVDRLAERVRGKDYSHYVLLHGVAQHTLYHTGQIAILKRLVQSDMAR